LEAIDALKEAIRLDPNMSNAQRMLAGFYGQLGRHEEAVLLLSDAAQLRNSDAELLLHLGMANLQAGTVPAAVEVFKRVIDLQPKLADAHVSLGIAYGQLGQLSEAVSAFNEAVTLEPRNPTANYNLGIALQKLGKHANAVAALKRVAAHLLRQIPK